MESFLEILTRLYLLVYGYSFILLAEWLEKGGFERIFKHPMQMWHAIVILLLFAVVTIILPNLVNCIIGVALLFLWIGYKLHN